MEGQGGSDRGLAAQRWVIQMLLSESGSDQEVGHVLAALA
jgi:hypothetical protein